MSSAFAATCHRHPFATADRAAWDAHMVTDHGLKYGRRRADVSMTQHRLPPAELGLWDAAPAPTKPPAKTPKPFSPKLGAVGSWVAWEETVETGATYYDPEISRRVKVRETVRLEGQIWSEMVGKRVAVVTDDQKVHEISLHHIIPAAAEEAAA